MDAQQFSKFRHQAVHELMHLNQLCEEQFRISALPRWDYELGRGTLTFSENGVPKVSAMIQVVGTTSVSDGTWMWGWANKSLPQRVKTAVGKVREFGRAESISELTKSVLPDDEHLGWEMTAIAAKVLGAKGAYRCPGENGFVYLIYSSIGFAGTEPDTATETEEVECDDHGCGFATYVCEHLVSNPDQQWFSDEISEENKWPDAWCATCESFFQEQGEWNESNESKMRIKVLCHYCYERMRSKANPHN
jgi:hypothetical protein